MTDGPSLILNIALLMESRAKRGEAFKLMRGVRVLDSVKMFACMFGGM